MLGAILTLHRVVEPAALQQRLLRHDNLEVSTTFLGSAIDRLQESGYAFVSMDQIHAELTGERQSLPERFLALTFDDGYSDNYHVAYPLLRQYGLPFALYLIAGFPDKRTLHYGQILEDWVRARETIDFRVAGESYRFRTDSRERKITALGEIERLLGRALEGPDYGAFFEDHQVPCGDHTLSWTQVAEMAADPLVTIGSHTLTHPALQDCDERQLGLEIHGSKARIEEALKCRVDHFSYPFGAWGPREQKVAADAGYRSIVTTEQRALSERDSVLALPRLTLGHDDFEALERCGLLRPTDRVRSA